MFLPLFLNRRMFLPPFLAAALLLAVSSLAAAECRDGWTPYSGSCYYLHTRPAVTWENAKVLCDSIQGHLAEIETPEENNFLARSLLEPAGVDRAWLGLEDVVVEGQFVWVSTQEVPEYSNWHPGNPSNSGSGEDCGELFPDGLWNDAPCEARMGGFICETESLVGAPIG